MARIDEAATATAVATASAAPVLHISYVKSGSYFLWQTFDALFRAAGQKRSFVQSHPIQQKRGCWPEFSIEQFDIDQILVQDEAVYWQVEMQHVEPIRDLGAYLAACSHVWTHSFLCERSWEVYPRFPFVCCIVRDPRDALVSMAHFVQTPFMRRYHPHPSRAPEEYVAAELDTFLGDWVRHAGDHWRARKALDVEFVFYERMVADLPGHLRRLADRVGLPLDAAQLAAVAAGLGIDAMKQKNPQHVRKGGSGGFRDLLTPAQQERALAICGPTMRELGYEV
ncbi:MAG: sulfotransferase domain-containing protein [Planctomycetes bacterium]|nr:sulfotransferase domain-containing protein [Planctomycetota bacterium]